MNSKESVMKFPCTFPLKAMGLNSEAFVSAVLSVVQKHVDGPVSCTRRSSSGDKYLSVTVTFTASSRQQLDAIYRELHANDLVLMTL